MIADYAFDKPVKIYVFKNENEVSVSFLITPICVQQFNFTLDEFKAVIDGWRSGDCMTRTDEGSWWWEYRDCGPRPECVPMEFVAISHGGFNYRLSVAEMEQVEKDYIHQLNNKNHWD